MENTNNQFGLSEEEEVKEAQEVFGTPMQNGFGNINQESLNSPKKSKKGLFITGVTVGVVFVLVLITGIGVFAYNVFNNSSAESSTSKKVEFISGANSQNTLAFKLQEIKRGVKVKKGLANATVYVFEVENTGRDNEAYYSLRGLSKDGAVVTPVFADNIENKAIFEENNCKNDETELIKGEKNRICFVYPISISKILVSEKRNNTMEYHAVAIDSEARSSNEFSVETKKKGDALSTIDYKHKVMSSTTFSDVTEAVDTYDSKASVIVATTLIKEDNKYAARDYSFIAVELEDGTYYYESDQNYKVEGTLSDYEMSQKLVEGVKKGEEIKYTITFPRSDKKIKNIVTCSFNTENEGSTTSVFPV